MSKSDLLFDQLKAKKEKKQKQDTDVLTLLLGRETFPLICQDVSESIPLLEGVILDKFDSPSRVHVKLSASRIVPSDDEAYETLNVFERILFAHPSWKAFFQWFEAIYKMIPLLKQQYPPFLLSNLLERIQFKETIVGEFNRFKTAWETAHPNFECKVAKDFYSVAKPGDLLSTLKSHVPVLIISWRVVKLA